MHNAFGTSKKYNKVLFNSRNTEFKTPFGAVSTRQRVSITFPVEKTMKAEKVFVVLRKGEDVRRVPTLRSPAAKQKRYPGYDVFETAMYLDTAGVYYYRFEIEIGDVISFVGRGENGQALVEDWLPEWQLSCYDESFRVPFWQRGGVIYHIFCDRFCLVGEPKQPKYGTMKKWNEDVTITDTDGVYKANDFYCGNLRGIISRLDYLSALGVTILYLSPVFEANSVHRYDTGDYEKIDGILGTESDFSSLIAEAKKRGMEIILDGVFNHTGADSRYFNKFGHYDSVGAYQSKDSPYANWFTFTDFPDLYDCWWGITCVPTVRRDCDEFHKYIAGEGGIIDRWTSLGIRGWRLDVVDELSSEFVEQIRKAIKRNDPSALVIGEVWEDASTKCSYGEERRYFQGRQLDGVMNYVFKDAIIDYVLHGNGGLFAERIMTVCENYPDAVLESCMTLLDSHDTFRIINALSQVDVSDTEKQYRKDYRLTEEQYAQAKKLLLLASAIQYFLPGMPSVYYGDEIGMEGFEDPINRRPFGFIRSDEELLKHYIRLGELRKTYRSSFVSGINSLDDIDYNGDIIAIRRGELTLFVNQSDSDVSIDKVFDLLSSKDTVVIKSKTAVAIRTAVDNQ